MKSESNFKTKPKITYVLVDEDQQIRDEWLRVACSKDLLLLTYSSPDFFLWDLSKGIFQGKDRFYFDQDFGKVRGIGIQLSKEVKNRWPLAYTCLVTSHPKGLFYDELSFGIVDDVLSKFPSPFDGSGFERTEGDFEEDFRRRYLKYFYGLK